MDHTIQFAVYVMVKGILQSLNIDINKVNGNDENKSNIDNHNKNSGHHKQLSNFYAKLERDQLAVSDLEYMKLREWILYIQTECNNSRINNGT